MTKPSAAVYARISDDKKKDGEKVAGQIADCEELAKSLGVKVVHVYAEQGSTSAFKEDTERPEFDAMLLAVEDGQYDIILATEEERLDRGRRTDKADLFNACLSGGATWHTIRDGAVNPKDEGAEFMSEIRSAVGRQEVRRKRSRQLAEYRKRIAKGKPLWGNRPFGFKKNRTTHHKTEAAEVKRAYESFLSDDPGRYGNLYAIQKDWNERGITTSTGKKWTYASVRRLLERPSNAGILVYKGQEQPVKARWKPLVDRETYDAAQRILRNPKRRQPAGRKPVHLLAGIAVCGVCGQPMRSSTGNGEPILKCASKFIAQPTDSKHPTIATRLIDPLIAPAVADAVAAGEASDAKPIDFKPVDADLAKVHAARQRLLDLVMDGAIEQVDASPQLKKLKSQEEALAEKRADLERQQAQNVMAVNMRDRLFYHDEKGRLRGNLGFGLHDLLVQRFNSLDLPTQRRLVKELLVVTINTGRGPGRVTVKRRLLEEEHPVGA